MIKLTLVFVVTEIVMMCTLFTLGTVAMKIHDSKDIQ